MGVIDITPFSGDHCESTALVNMLRNRGIDLSEPMVFGLGQGLSFLYWHSKQMPAPFLAGRVKPDQLMRNAARALGLDLRERRTASRTKAESQLVDALDNGDVVGLKLDRYHLDYAHEDHHFAAHYVACVGYEDDRFVVVETSSLGIRSTSRQSMAEARAAKGPMSSRNLSFVVGPDGYDATTLADSCRSSIRTTAREFLRPPISNLGFKGIAKTGSVMRKGWDRLDNPGHVLTLVGNSMEDGGTGGGLFRTLWARFLEEAHGLTGVAAYAHGASEYHRISERWTEVANLLRDADDSTAPAALDEAAAIVDELATEEQKAMAELEEASR
ncbi:BtrH N-terminal domain-containing protein [Streptomyces sp. NRRL B-1347]|uniref:BtrH N-terminal domain-containing protein n=1 Tax=Streptomyces sp. NRRL B-1347 TaxID=1476877 RepID=UPI0004C9C46B|nr:BtrH N-terminal domain-containing protein [Streptomyces sp. NRRL B-1347]